MEILKCDGIRKVYGEKNNQVIALNGIDLSISKGEFVALVGASGSGKSTLLHILGSVDKPTSGKVVIDGTELSTLNRTQAAVFRRRKVGLVYQFYNLTGKSPIRSILRRWSLLWVFLSVWKPCQISCQGDSSRGQPLPGR